MALRRSSLGDAPRCLTLVAVDRDSAPDTTPVGPCNPAFQVREEANSVFGAAEAEPSRRAVDGMTYTLSVLKVQHIAWHRNAATA